MCPNCIFLSAELWQCSGNWIWIFISNILQQYVSYMKTNWVICEMGLYAWTSLRFSSLSRWALSWSSILYQRTQFLYNYSFCIYAKPAYDHTVRLWAFVRGLESQIGVMMHKRWRLEHAVLVSTMDHTLIEGQDERREAPLALIKHNKVQCKFWRTYTYMINYFF